MLAHYTRVRWHESRKAFAVLPPKERHDGSAHSVADNIADDDSFHVNEVHSAPCSICALRQLLNECRQREFIVRSAKGGSRVGIGGLTMEGWGAVGDAMIILPIS